MAFENFARLKGGGLGFRGLFGFRVLGFWGLGFRVALKEGKALRFMA